MNLLLNAREGRVLVNRHDKYIGQAVTFYGEYSELEAQLLRQVVQPGQVVIEVGANMGLHTLVLSKAVGPTGQVIAYEPQRAMFQVLCANMALNDVLNVDARPHAVGAEYGIAHIPLPDYSRPGNFGGVSFAEGSHAYSRPVRVVTLNGDIALNPSLIKIDVEGMEEPVLRGASMLIHKRKPILYVENDRLPKSRSLIETIWALDYDCYWHVPPLYNPENFFGNRVNVWPEGLASINMVCIHRGRPVNIEGLAKVERANEHPLVKEPALADIEKKVFGEDEE